MNKLMTVAAPLLSLALLACGAAPTQGTLEDDTHIASKAVELVVKPTPEQLDAARAGRPLPEPSLSAACHAASTCPTSYGSCSSWSGYSACGSTSCSTCRFRECDTDGVCYPVLEPATLQSYERYRVCFNAYGQACTEYQVYAEKSCGSC